MTKSTLSGVLFVCLPLDAIIESMDIRAGILTTIILAVLFALLLLRAGIRSIQSARKLTFYRLRQQRTSGGWRMLGLGIFLLLAAAWLGRFGAAGGLPIFSTFTNSNAICQLLPLFQQ